jgi:FAD-dependent pyridine nucleotide-disulfide oxidoreductase
VPNEGGRVLGEDGEPLTGIYATGWIRRGPVGLIGSTKSDAQETIANLVSDASAGLLHAKTQDEAQVGHDALIALLESRGIPFTTWEGWELLDAYERELGESCDEVVVTGGESKPRERVKVVSREAMTAISRSTEVPEDLIGAPEADRVPERVADRLKG